MSDQRLVCEMSTLLLLTTGSESSPRRLLAKDDTREHNAGKHLAAAPCLRVSQANPTTPFLILFSIRAQV